MADWQEQLNTILSDPDAMAQLASIAQSLGGAPPENAKGETPNAPDAEPLGQLAPLMRALQGGGSNETAALLRALKPFLSEKRRGKVEQAAQLAHLIRIGKTFLSEEGGHV